MTSQHSYTDISLVISYHRLVYCDDKNIIIITSYAVDSRVLPYEVGMVGQIVNTSIVKVL